MKILVLGNSHLAVLKNSWADIEARRPDLSADFIGRPGGRGGMTGLEIVDGLLRPKRGETGFFSSVQGHQFRIADYGAFVLIGYPQIVLDPKRYSKALLEKYAEDYVLSKRSKKIDGIASLINESTKASVVLVPEPFRIDGTMKTDIPSYVHVINTLDERYFRASGYRLVSQPVDTIHEERMATKSVYGTHPDDPLHMNKEFGVLLWNRIMHAIGKPEEMRA